MNNNNSPDIIAKQNGKGRDMYYVAECPVCGYRHSVDVHGSEVSAKLLAEQNVKTHFRSKHITKTEGSL